MGSYDWTFQCRSTRKLDSIHLEFDRVREFELRIPIQVRWCTQIWLYPSSPWHASYLPRSYLHWLRALSFKIMRLVQSCTGMGSTGKNTLAQKANILHNESKANDRGYSLFVMFHWWNIRLLEYDFDHGAESGYSCFWMTRKLLLVRFLGYKMDSDEIL